jgi:catalase
MFIHSQKRHPRTNLRSANMQWDFWSMCPESLHQVTWLFGDRGIPKSYRHMDGFSSHTYSMVSDEGERVWVKFHMKTQQGIENLTNEEAAALIAQDRESHGRDLYESIKNGDFPRWTMHIQVMTDQQAQDFRWNPFDLTKVWPQGDFPLIEVGVFELNRNPENYFAEIEQAAFNPGSFVPGIGPSPDKMLQGRLMSYQDTHLYRLGVNYRQLAVNKPKVKVSNYQRDGFMYQPTAGQTGHPNYYPNSITDAPKPHKRYAEPSWDVGAVADRYNSREGHDDYTQAGDLYRLLSEAAKLRLVQAIASALGGCRQEIIDRQLPHFYKADEDYGRRVEEAIEQGGEFGGDGRAGHDKKAELGVNDDVPEGEAVRN